MLGRFVTRGRRCEGEETWSRFREWQHRWRRRVAKTYFSLFPFPPRDRRRRRGRNRVWKRDSKRGEEERGAETYFFLPSFPPPLPSFIMGLLLPLLIDFGGGLTLSSSSSFSLLPFLARISGLGGGGGDGVLKREKQRGEAERGERREAGRGKKLTLEERHLTHPNQQVELGIHQRPKRTIFATLSKRQQK